MKKLICFLLCAFGLLGQTKHTLSLSSATGVPGDTVTIHVSLVSQNNSAVSTRPSGLNFTVNFSPIDLQLVSVEAGPAATAAGKLLTTTTNGPNIFLIFGMANTTPIDDGIVASMSFKILATSQAATIPVSFVDAIAADPTASVWPITALGETTITIAPPTIKSLQCPPAVTPPSSATCTITLSSQAPQSGLVITLSANSQNLSLPASIVVPGGQTTLDFVATPTATTTAVSMSITASIAGVTRSIAVSPNPTSPTARLTNLVCSPSQVVGIGSTICTITLDRQAPQGGLAVVVSSSNSIVSVPTTVMIPAGAVSMDFAATVNSAVSASISVMLVASEGGVTKYFGVDLVPSGPGPANVQLGSFACNPTQVSTPGKADCTITLTGLALAGGATISLSSGSSSVVPLPPTIAIPAGANNVSFPAQAQSLSASVNVTLTASYQGVSKSVTLTYLVAPSSGGGPGNGPSITRISCNSTTLSSGASQACQVFLSGPVSSTTPIAVSFDNSALSLRQASVLVQAGASNVPFGVGRAAGSPSGSGTMTLSVNGSSKSLTFTMP